MEQKSTIHLGNRDQVVLTENFTKLVVAYQHAICHKKIVGVISPQGIGFKYALNSFAEKHYLKVVFCNVRYASTVRQLFIELVKHLCNVKFSNINYQNTTLPELIRVVIARLKIGDSCLLCIDNCNLKGAQLKYFIRFLNDFKRPIGLVFRMNSLFASKLSRSKNDRLAYERLLEIVDGWRVLQSPSEEEIRDIAISKGVSDKTLLDDLVKNCNNNLTLMNKAISRIKAGVQ